MTGTTFVTYGFHLDHSNFGWIAIPMSLYFSIHFDAIPLPEIVKQKKKKIQIKIEWKTKENKNKNPSISCQRERKFTDKELKWDEKNNRYSLALS